MLLKNYVDWDVHRSFSPLELRTKFWNWYYRALTGLPPATSRFLTDETTGSLSVTPYYSSLSPWLKSRHSYDYDPWWRSYPYYRRSDYTTPLKSWMYSRDYYPYTYPYSYYRYPQNYTYPYRYSYPYSSYTWPYTSYFEKNYPYYEYGRPYSYRRPLYSSYRPLYHWDRSNLWSHHPARWYGYRWYY